MADQNPFASMNPPQGWPAGAVWPPRIGPDGQVLQPAGWPGGMDWNKMQNTLAAIRAQAPAAQAQGPQTAAPAAQAPASAPAAQAQGPRIAGPGGVDLPPELTSSAAFAQHSAAYIGSGWTIRGANAQMGPGGVPSGSWTVEYLGPDQKSTISVNYTSTPDGIQATGSSASLQTQTAAEAAQKAAATNLTTVQARVASGQATAQELENAQREANLAAGKGANTDTAVAQINAANAGAAATIGNTQASQANVDLAYVQAVAQVLEKQGYAANQAYQMALDYAQKKATVDQANTNTVVNAATSLLNNDTANRNARMNAATQGFSQDVQQALALNDTMPVGSGDAAKVLAALTGLRRATAGKWGAFDENVPPVLRQLGYNTPIGMASINYDDVMNQANALRAASGTTNDAWPQIPGRPFNGQYTQAPGSFTSAQTPTSAAAGTGFKPIAWDSGTRAAAPVGSPAQVASDNAVQAAIKAGGGQALSQVGADGMVWISDPTAPGGRRLISHRDLPAQAPDLDVTSLPRPDDSRFAVPGSEQSRAPRDPNADLVAQTNRQQQLDMLRVQREDDDRMARQARFDKLIMSQGASNPYDDFVDGNRQPWQINLY